MKVGNFLFPESRDPTRDGAVVDETLAEARLEEAEGILFGAWAGRPFAHAGRFWKIELPMLRPRPFTPRMPVIRAASGEASVIEFGRQGRPFLMNVQSNEVTSHRIALYRQAMREQGFDEAAIAERLGACWVWRNVFVAETDAEAMRIGVPAFAAMQEHRAAMRERIYAQTGKRLQPATATPAARTMAEHALICGSPSTVAEALSQVAAIGIGGLIMQFRLGPMPYELAKQSLTLFAERVRPSLCV